MKHIRNRLMWISVLVLILMTNVGVGFAGKPDFPTTQFDALCDEQIVGYFIGRPHFYTDLVLTVLVNGVQVGQATYPALFDEYTGFYANTYNFTPQAGENHFRLMIEYVELVDEVLVVWNTEEFILLQNCGEETEETPQDMRFCFAPGEARAALYAISTGDGGYLLDIYAVDNHDTGERVFRRDSRELAQIAPNPNANVVIVNGLMNNISLHRLSNGWYQVNVGPTDEAKVHVCLFNGILPTQIIKWTIE